MLSNSTPYNLDLSNSLGNLPKKLPIAQLGSKIFPFSNPNFFNVLYIPSIAIFGV